MLHSAAALPDLAGAAAKESLAFMHHKEPCPPLNTLAYHLTIAHLDSHENALGYCSLTLHEK